MELETKNRRKIFWLGILLLIPQSIVKKSKKEVHVKRYLELGHQRIKLENWLYTYWSAIKKKNYFWKNAQKLA